jgi:hypothetical protein
MAGGPPAAPQPFLTRPKTSGAPSVRGFLRTGGNHRCPRHRSSCPPGPNPLRARLQAGRTPPRRRRHLAAAGWSGGAAGTTDLPSSTPGTEGKRPATVPRPVPNQQHISLPPHPFHHPSCDHQPMAGGPPAVSQPFLTNHESSGAGCPIHDAASLCHEWAPRCRRPERSAAERLNCLPSTRLHLSRDRHVPPMDSSSHFCQTSNQQPVLRAPKGEPELAHPMICRNPTNTRISRTKQIQHPEIHLQGIESVAIRRTK